MNRTQRFVSATAILLIAFCAAPPRSSFAGDDWLPIPPADLALKDNPASPGADAMILYRESDMDSREASIREYFRIKIFTQAGVSQADVELPFVREQVNIMDVRGRTIHPDGTIVNFDGKVLEKTKVKANGIKVLAKTFTLPDVHPGSIIEYKFREQSDSNYIYNNSWIITGDLFTRDARFTIRPDTRGFAWPMFYRQYGLPNGTVPTRQSDGTYVMDIHNIAGLESEEYRPPDRALQVRVDFYYVNPDDPKNETPAQFWNRKAKTWSETVDHFVGKKGALQADLSNTVSPDDPPEVKLRKIFARVQKIRDLWMEEARSAKEQKQEQLKPNENVEDVLKRGYATGRQLNYTFVGLARAAGFTADEVFVAPRNDRFFIPNMMDASQLSADIVWVHAGSQDYYLDPAAITYPFGVLPWYESNTEGIRCTKSGGEIVSIPAAPPGQATRLRTADLTIDVEGEASGQLQVDFTGQWAAALREVERDEDDTGRRKTFTDMIESWLPAGSSFKLSAITNWDKIELPLRIEGAVKIPALGSDAGRRMLVPSSVFQVAQAAAFQPEKRHYPVYIQYPYEEIDDLKFHVPAGYKIESLPPAKQIKPGVVSYETSALQQGDTIEVKRHLVIDGALIAVVSYPALRNFFNTVKTNDESQIVLQNAVSAKNN